MKVLIVVEQTSSGFSAFSPDVPGCIATGATQAEVEANMREAVRFHIESLREAGETAPSPTSYAVVVEVTA